MQPMIFLALAAFVIIFTGGILLSLVKYLPFDKSARRIVEALVAAATIAALIILVLVPLIRGM